MTRSGSPISASATSFRPMPRIGIALAPQDGTELDQLIKNADLAMYARQGRTAAEPTASSSRSWTPAPRPGSPWSRTCGRRCSTAASRSTTSRSSICAQRGVGLRGAAALAPSRTRHGFAGRIHSGRGRHRPDQRTRRLGAQDRLRRGGDLAGSHPARRQRFAGSAEMPDAGAEDRQRARRLRSCRRAGWNSRSPRRC